MQVPSLLRQWPHASDGGHLETALASGHRPGDARTRAIRSRARGQRYPARDPESVRPPIRVQKTSHGHSRDQTIRAVAPYSGSHGCRASPTPSVTPYFQTRTHGSSPLRLPSVSYTHLTLPTSDLV